MKYKIWILYLRKSRQDDPNETVEEVLAKHEIWLQEWAEKNLGHRIPEEFIIREVVSGEKISDRPGMMKLHEPSSLRCTLMSDGAVCAIAMPLIASADKRVSKIFFMMLKFLID